MFVAAGTVLAHLLQLEGLTLRAVEERLERRELTDGAEVDRLLLGGGHAAFPVFARHAELLADLCSSGFLRTGSCSSCCCSATGWAVDLRLDDGISLCVCAFFVRDVAR